MLLDSVRHLNGLRSASYAIEQDCEFVSAESRYLVSRSKAVTQPVCNPYQELVAYHMTDAVVDQLKPIEVQKQNSEEPVFLTAKLV
jgi:hypothetical protein